MFLYFIIKHHIDYFLYKVVISKHIYSVILHFKTNIKLVNNITDWLKNRQNVHAFYRSI